MLVPDMSIVEGLGSGQPQLAWTAPTPKEWDGDYRGDLVESRGAAWWGLSIRLPMNGQSDDARLNAFIPRYSKIDRCGTPSHG
jgi:hypothetical protein